MFRNGLGNYFNYCNRSRGRRKIHTSTTSRRILSNVAALKVVLSAFPYLLSSSPPSSLSPAPVHMLHARFLPSSPLPFSTYDLQSPIILAPPLPPDRKRHRPIRHYGPTTHQPTYKVPLVKTPLETRISSAYLKSTKLSHSLSALKIG